MKTTRLILTLVITIMALKSYSQNSNEFRFYYGISDSELLREPMLGGAGFQSEKLNEFGIKYLKLVFDKFYIETGINYSKSDVKIIPEFVEEPVISGYEKLEIVSIPILANYTFWKYLFVNG
ncbi:MAG: hypothetical protein Q8J84_04620 [Flavobacteriaceae bacterium]|nr:hypothetical protein [Flavobacteriaceae bacterium]